MYFSLEKNEYLFRGTCDNELEPEPHMHSHIEIIYIRKNGKSRAFTDNQPVVIEENDLLIVFPNQIHYFEDIVRPMTVDVLIISPEMCPEFKSIFEKYLPENPIFKNAGDNPIIKISVATILECAISPKKHSETLARGALLMLLSEFFKAVKLKKVESHNLDKLKEILNYCYKNYTSEISLESMSEALHISRFYISRIFNKELHISFSCYINILRIRKACELLKSNEKSITEIAFDVGYNSVRSFNRCFAQIKGTSPKKYQINAIEK